EQFDENATRLLGRQPGMDEEFGRWVRTSELRPLWEDLLKELDPDDRDTLLSYFQLNRHAWRRCANVLESAEYLTYLIFNRARMCRRRPLSRVQVPVLSWIAARSASGHRRPIDWGRYATHVPPAEVVPDTDHNSILAAKPFIDSFARAVTAGPSLCPGV